MTAERFVIAFIFMGLAAYFFPDDRAIAAIVVGGFFVAMYFENDILELKSKVEDLEHRIDRLESPRHYSD